ncbi:uncharacterized protein LOC131681783 [Topomyia yanbarensis]|uniref:uncharacterized protein LOC131681783 n=1 Tax=Topomyia yanbarensis TaxID=2498891 RepID=UPI00273C7F3D|nr:uncharacterized protein LOC131681783 [Topomyia yanbarensis]
MDIIPVRQCRLCLHYVEESDGTECPAATHTQEDTKNHSLIAKIRECLGVSAPPDGSLFICRNCTVTVDMIDEFRTLCQQAAEIYNLVPILSVEDAKCMQYYNSVNELHKFIREKRNAVSEVVAGREPEFIDVTLDEFPIKQEPEIDDEKLQSELLEDEVADDHVVVYKMENVSESEEDDVEDYEMNDCDSSPTPSRVKRRKARERRAETESRELGRTKNGLVEGKRLISLPLKLAIAQEVRKHPQLWDISIASSAQIIDETWAKLAQKFETDLPTFRFYWRRMKDNYRILQKRKKKITGDSTYARLISVLTEIYDGGKKQIISEEGVNAKVIAKDGGDPFRNDKRKLILLQTVYNFPVIWNSKHLDHYNQDVRDHVWDQIAADLGVAPSKAKECWKGLRVFKKRLQRLTRGQLQQKYPLITDALYKMLTEIFGTVMEEAEETDAVKTSELLEEFKVFENDRKLELAQICFDYEIIWNTRHPDHSSSKMKDATWDEIAGKMNISRAEAKYQWIRLRGVYRARYLRLLEGLSSTEDKVCSEPLYQLLEKMLSGNMKIGKSSGVSERRSNLFLNNVELRIRLLEEISKHENLWNTNHPDFRNKRSRESNWKKIAAEFDVKPLAVKSEWIRLKEMHSSAVSDVSCSDQNMSTDERLHTLLNQLLPTTEKKAPKEILKEIDGKPRKDLMREGPKRRFRGMTTYDSTGCVQIADGKGTMRHYKICELCGKPVERSLFEYHMNQHNGLKPYACSFVGCDRQYSNKITRNRHEVIDHGEDGFKFDCSECGAKFKQRSRFELHYALKHKSQELPCDLCGKLFKHRKLLQKHKVLHTSHHTCKVCGKILQKKWTLHVHMRVHTKEKPYPCELCDQRFMLKVQMKTHLLKVHGVLLQDLEAMKASAAISND